MPAHMTDTTRYLPRTRTVLISMMKSVDIPIFFYFFSLSFSLGQEETTFFEKKLPIKMIDKVLDMCRLYPLARRWRGVKIRLDTFIHDKSNHSRSTSCEFEKEITWSKQYVKEERRGIALLQRIRRLEVDRVEILEPKEEVGESLGMGSRLYIIDEEQQNARQLYRAHRERFRHLWSTKPKCSFSVEVEMARKTQYTRHNRPLVWRKQADACISTGGCCGRDCGCCKKPLMTVPSRKKKALCGHCTVECGCCAKYHGCYTSDPCIKED